MATKKGRVERQTAHQDHSCASATGWTGGRALVPRCGEEDGGGLTGIIMALSRPHMSMEMGYFHSDDGGQSEGPGATGGNDVAG